MSITNDKASEDQQSKLRLSNGDSQAQYENPEDAETAAEKKLLRKLDIHIIPMMMLLYCFSFLDRVNIGNARLYKLEEDLNMTGNMYQTAVSLLFVTYLAFEIPSNLVLKKFRPSRWIAFITASWGIVATLTGITQTYGGLIACRLVLGIFEAGLFPGCTMYLTFFYTKKELALRIGYLFVSAAIAGAFGGLLAFAIGHLDGYAGMHGWRWIMIIEGLPTFCLGIATWFLLADDPQSARYLTDEEKEMMAQRLSRQYGETQSEDTLHKRDVMAAFKDWKCWAFAISQFGTDTMLYGYSTFLPTIIQGLGKWTPAEVQALTIPCYTLGAVTYLVVAHFSDGHQKRGIPTIIFGFISVVGYLLLIAPTPNGVKFLGCFLVAMGLYVVVGIPLSWNVNNIPRYGKKTTASGLQLTIGNTSGVAAPFLYATKDGPRFIKGHATTLAMVGMATLIYVGLWRYYIHANKQRDSGKMDHLLDGKSKEDIAKMADDSPRFRYMI